MEYLVVSTLSFAAGFASCVGVAELIIKLEEDDLRHRMTCEPLDPQQTPSRAGAEIADGLRTTIDPGMPAASKPTEHHHV